MVEGREVQAVEEEDEDGVGCQDILDEMRCVEFDEEKLQIW